MKTFGITLAFLLTLSLCSEPCYASEPIVMTYGSILNSDTGEPLPIEAAEILIIEGNGLISYSFFDAYGNELPLGMKVKYKVVNVETDEVMKHVISKTRKGFFFAPNEKASYKIVAHPLDNDGKETEEWISFFHVIDEVVRPAGWIDAFHIQMSTGDYVGRVFMNEKTIAQPMPPNVVSKTD